MNVLDASVLIGYLDERDVHHAAAVDTLAAATDGYTVHPLTLAEVLVRPAKLGQIEPVMAVLGELGVHIDETTLDPVQLAEIRSTTGLRMPDCCVLVSAVNVRGRILTFDDKFRAAGAGLVNG